MFVFSDKQRSRNEPRVHATFCRAFCSPLGQINLIKEASASCAVLQLMQTIYLTPPNSCFLSLPDICSFVLFWSGLDRPSTHGCHSLGQAPTAFFTDWPFFLHSTLGRNFLLFCHSGVSVSPGCSHSLL